MAAALAFAGGARADHAIAVIPQAPAVSMVYPVSDAPPGFYAYILSFSASWAPEATRYEGTLTMNDVTAGVSDQAHFYDNGDIIRTSDVLHTDWVGVGGHTYSLSTNWSVYGRDNQFDWGQGVGASPPAIVIPPVITKKVMGDDLQKALRNVSGRGFGATDAVLAIVGSLSKTSYVAAGGPGASRLAGVVGSAVALESAALQAATLALRDPRYAKVAPRAALKPTTLTAGGGVTASAVAAANAYVADATAAIASARALGTAVSRAATARDRKAAKARRAQAKAAAKHARTLAAALSKQAADATRLRAALAQSPLGSATVDQLQALQVAAAKGTYPQPAAATFTRLRATKAERESIRGGLMLNYAPQLPTDGVAELTRPEAIAELRSSAKLLLRFAKRL
jgi:hypothetical protein